MRHCAKQYESDCRTGDTLIVSVRLGERRVATAEIARQGCYWTLRQVKGFANRSAPPRLISALHTFAGRLWEEPWLKAASKATICDVEEPADDVDVEDDSAELLDMAVAWELDAVPQPHDGCLLLQRIDAWLERQNDEGNLSFRYNGRLLLERQFDDWMADPELWFSHAHDIGILSDERHDELATFVEPLVELTVE